MKKRYIYHPNDWMDDSYVVKEFTAMMGELQIAHRCPVRLVKTKCLFGYHYAVYELCPEISEIKGCKMKHILILVIGILIGFMFEVVAFPNDPLCDSKLQYCEHTQEVAFEYGYKAGIEDCVD